MFGARIPAKLLQRIRDEATASRRNISTEFEILLEEAFAARDAGKPHEMERGSNRSNARELRQR